MARLQKNIVLVLLSVLLLTGVLTIFLWINTLFLQSKQITQFSPFPAQPLDQNIIESLSQAIQINTVSNATKPDRSPAQFEQFVDFLKLRFPNIFNELQVELNESNSLLFRWPGKNAQSPANLFLAHYDVVSVAQSEIASWTHPPFSGAIADGFIWGRGALDDKSAVIALLSSINSLMQSGFTPSTTLYIALQQDEETGGHNGAKKLGQYFANNNIKINTLFDEGMPITQNIMAGFKQKVAMVGIGEKGLLSLQLRVDDQGGHASSPPPQTAVGIIASAVARIEANPLPAKIEGATKEMLLTLAPEAGFPRNLIFGNLWLFSPLVAKQLTQKYSTNAMIRTTAATTQFFGSEQINVLPQSAAANINFRLLPGTTIENVMTYVRDTIADKRIKINVLKNAIEAPPISSTGTLAYKALSTAIREVFENTVVTPSILIAATDSRHFTQLAKQTYRFRPVIVGPLDVPRFHGQNERISIEGFHKMVTFYHRLIINLSNQN